MELDDRAFPLTRGQLDILLVQQTVHAGTDSHPDLLMRTARQTDPDLMESAIRRTVGAVKQRGVAFFEGQVFQKAAGHPRVELGFYDLSRAQHPVQEARETAPSIQRAPTPRISPVLKFGSLPTWLDEFSLLDVDGRSRLDGWDNWAALLPQTKTVGGPGLGHVEHSGLTQPPPDAGLTDICRCWGANFSLMSSGRSEFCSATSQFNSANVLDAGMPA
jgi:hypothetical protein